MCGGRALSQDQSSVVNHEQLEALAARVNAAVPPAVLPASPEPAASPATPSLGADMVVDMDVTGGASRTSQD